MYIVSFVHYSLIQMSIFFCVCTRVVHSIFKSMWGNRFYTILSGLEVWKMILQLQPPLLESIKKALKDDPKYRKFRR